MVKTIVCHLFYPAIAQQLLQQLKLIVDERSEIIINIQGNSEEHYLLYKQIKGDFPDAYVLMSPNKGRDIGAKMLLINLLFQLNLSSDYTLIIHDKKSPHLENGDFWREELFKIIQHQNVIKVFNLFEKYPQVGIVGSAKYIQNEYISSSDSFACNSNLKIKELQKRYNVQTADYNFMAGNMFWIRTPLLRCFFATRSLLQIRSDLESGNALDFEAGTYIHSWERIMSWIATSQGYKIYGI